jgi:predicted transposase YdaD
MFREERREGRQEGRQEGELTILRLQIEKRFGALPPWAAEKLASLPTCDLEELSVRLLDIATLEELLR